MRQNYINKDVALKLIAFTEDKLKDILKEMDFYENHNSSGYFVPYFGYY